MTDFLKQQLDYLVFLYAFSFFVIAAVCYGCHKQKLLGMQWIWLTYFGLFHGVHELLKLINYSLSITFIIETLSSVFMIMSFICLFEFGRTQLKIKGKIIARHLLYLPLLSFSLVTVVAGEVLFLSVLKYIFCLVGGILASAALIKSSNNLPQKRSMLITVSGILLLLFAIFNGFVGTDATIFSESTTNIPLQVIRSIIVIFMAMSLYIFNFRAFCPDQRKKTSAAKLRLCYLEIVSVLLILSLGWTLSHISGERAEKDFRANLLQQTLTAASAIDHEKIAGIINISDSMRKTGDAQILMKIQKIKSAYGLASKNVYLLIRKNREIIFALDSKAEKSGDNLQLTSTYNNAPKAINRVFNKFMPITYGPYTDQWGTWVSGFAPLFAKGTTSNTIVIGMDVDAAMLIHQVNVARLIWMALALLLCILVIVLFANAQISLQSRINVATSEGRYASLINGSQNCITFFDIQGKLLTINHAGLETMGWLESDVVGKSMCDIVEIDMHAGVGPMEDGETTSFEATCRRKSDGELLHWQIMLNPLEDEDGFCGFAGIWTDITEIKKNENKLRVQASAIDAASDQILITDIRGGIQFVNKSFENETGFSFDEVVNKPPSVLKSGRQNNDFYSDLWKTVNAGKTWRGEVVNRRKDGTEFAEDMTITPVKNETGIVEHFIAIKRNITDKKEYEAKLDHLAHHDHLTGLPNRLLFSDRLSQLLEMAKANKTELGVLFVDLDRFKIINDTLGHNFGDVLLKHTAERLRSCLREKDTLARMGGDEFTVLINEMQSPEEAVFVADRILKRLAEPFMIKGHELVVSGSIGISIYPDDGTTVEALVKNADTAMYKAKEQGRNNCQVYSETMNIAALKRMNMEYGLRKAIERDEFILHYQPKMDCFTGKLLGAEALIRWYHPDFGLVPPGDFIQIAEETGLIIPISEWVLRTTCNQNKAWQNAGYADIRIAVNISARHFQTKNMLVSTVNSVFEETGLDPQYLELEITESLLMQNADQAIQTLKDLKSMGLSLSIDDFGTGYSSLSYLKQFPIDAVKIDRSFIKDVTTNPDDASISGAIVAMAHNLKMEVIAEGVETVDQLNFLRSIGCDEIQGYFISPPVPAADFEHFLIHAEIDDCGSKNAA